MAHHVEPMDIDDIESAFDNKENTYHHSNVLPRSPCTEKGYEELDVSELNMKLRYSMTPAASPMSKSMSHCVDNRYSTSPEKSLDNITVNENNLTRSLNSSLNKTDLRSKTVPLQALPADLIDDNRNSTVLRSLDATDTTHDVTITVSNENEIDNMSFPSSSSSMTHTPEATTPTKEIPKSEGSPIMRGLKSVLSMFRSSQSPIPPSEETKVVDEPIAVPVPQASASTPVNPKHVEKTRQRKSSPHKESIVFNEDLEKELQWTDDSTIVFSTEKIPIHKLFFQDKPPNSKKDTVSQPEKVEDVNSSVEYMDISYNNDLSINATANKTKVDDILESDGEFVDCETTFTQDGPLANPTENDANKDSITENPKKDAVNVMDTTKDIIKLLDSSEVNAEDGEITRQLDFSTTDIVNRLSELIDASETNESNVTKVESNNTSGLYKKDVIVREPHLSDNNVTSPENHMKAENNTSVKIAENVSLVHDKVVNLVDIVPDSLNPQLNNVLPKVSSVLGDTAVPPVTQTFELEQEVVSTKTPEFASLASDSVINQPSADVIACIVSPVDIALTNEDDFNEVIDNPPRDNRFTIPVEEILPNPQMKTQDRIADVISDTQTAQSIIEDTTNIPCPSSILPSDVPLPHSDDNCQAQIENLDETITAAHESVTVQNNEITDDISTSHGLTPDLYSTIKIMPNTENNLIEASSMENNTKIPVTDNIFLPEKNDDTPINENAVMEGPVKVPEITILPNMTQNGKDCVPENTDIAATNQNDLIKESVIVESTEILVSTNIIQKENDTSFEKNIDDTSTNQNALIDESVNGDSTGTLVSTNVIKNEKGISFLDNIDIIPTHQNAIANESNKVDISEVPLSVNVIKIENEDLHCTLQNNIKLPSSNNNATNEMTADNANIETPVLSDAIQCEEKDLKCLSHVNIQLPPVNNDGFNEAMIERDTTAAPVSSDYVRDENEYLTSSNEVPKSNNQLSSLNDNNLIEEPTKDETNKIPSLSHEILHVKDLKTSSQTSIQSLPSNESVFNEKIIKNDTIENLVLTDAVQTENTLPQSSQYLSPNENIVETTITNQNANLPSSYEKTHFKIDNNVLESKDEEMEVSFCEHIREKLPECEAMDISVADVSLPNQPLEHIISTKVEYSHPANFKSSEASILSVEGSTKSDTENQNKVEVLEFVSENNTDEQSATYDTPKEVEDLKADIGTNIEPINSCENIEPLPNLNLIDLSSSASGVPPLLLSLPEEISIEKTVEIETKEAKIVKPTDAADECTHVESLPEITPQEHKKDENMPNNPESSVAKNSNENKNNDMLIEATTITESLQDLHATAIISATGNIDKCTEPEKNLDEEIVLSESNSPFISVSVEEQCESEATKDFQEIENPFDGKCKMATSPPISPKIVSKGYNFNFDDIDNINPFATKAKIRMSPPPGASPNTSLDAGNSYESSKQPLVNKDKPVNRRKSMPERIKPLKPNRNINSTFDSGSNIPSKQNFKIDEHKDAPEIDVTTVKPNSQMLPENDTAVGALSLEKVTQLHESAHINEIDKMKEELLPSVESNSKMLKETKAKEGLLNNDSKMFEDIVTDSLKSDESVKPDNTSSSEQSTYFSAGTSSTEGIESRNVFNLPEIDDKDFNPFATKSRIRQSPPPDSDIIDPFATKSKIKSSPETSFIIPQKEAPDNASVANDNSDTHNDLNNSCSSKSSEGKDTTVQEIHTEDEDTIEGPFIDAEDATEDDKEPNFDGGKVDVVDFNNVNRHANEDAESAEMFIDAEAFEFLMNQNKTDEVTYSGKESLFLKFDPLFARKVTSEGVAAALNELKRRQSTPMKPPKPPQEEVVLINTPVAGPSNVITTHEVQSAEDEKHDDMNVTISKPMMVVTPAVNSVVTPKKSVTPNRTNRLSMTFTSPAMAVIDRLLSLSGNSPSAGLDATVTPVSQEHSEADQALRQLRELLDEKEIDVYNLRCESTQLKSRLSTLETQMKSLEVEGSERLKRIDELTENLAEKTKTNRSMAAVVEEYERTIASLISETQQDKKRFAEERSQLIRERDEQTAHLTSMEVSFSDLHSKYEKSKQIIISYKANEDVYKNSIKEFEDNLAKMHANYELLKQHATSKLSHANQELEKLNKAHEAEMLKLNAMLKRKELHITSLEESLAQKTKANEELTAICDELINKVG